MSRKRKRANKTPEANPKCGAIAPEILRRTSIPGNLHCQLKRGHPGSHVNWKNDGIWRVWPAVPDSPYFNPDHKSEKANA